MKTNKSIFSASIILIMCLGVLMNLEDAKNYEQVACKFSPADKYISIKLENGVREKGISFVSDGVIFESSIVGRTYAKDYSDIDRVVYGKREGGVGLLSVHLVGNRGQVEREDIGIINGQCWDDLKDLLTGNPVSDHIGFDQD